MAGSFRFNEYPTFMLIEFSILFQFYYKSKQVWQLFAYIIRVSHNNIISYPGNQVYSTWVIVSLLRAYTEKTNNDPSGIDLIARVGNDVIVADSYDVRKKLPDLLAFIVELEKNGKFDKHKGRIFIEPKASGHSLADYIEADT